MVVDASLLSTALGHDSGLEPGDVSVVVELDVVHPLAREDLGALVVHSLKLPGALFLTSSDFLVHRAPPVVRVDGGDGRVKRFWDGNS